MREYKRADDGAGLAADVVALISAAIGLLGLHTPLSEKVITMVTAIVAGIIDVVFSGISLSCKDRNSDLRWEISRVALHRTLVLLIPVIAFVKVWRVHRREQYEKRRWRHAHSD